MDEIFTGFNEKYKINYKYVRSFNGWTCEFMYDNKKYGFTVYNSLKKDNSKTGKNKRKIELMSKEECVDEGVESFVDYLILNEKEKKKNIRYDKIDTKKYYLLNISNKEECYYHSTEVSDEKLEIESYVHSGLVSTYYIVNFYDNKNNKFGFSYSLGFMTLEFDGVPGYRSVYFRNVGDECMFLDFFGPKILIRPGEQLKLCKKNFINEKMRTPTAVGGSEIDEFDFFDK